MPPSHHQVIAKSSPSHITKWPPNGRIWKIYDVSEAKWYAHSFFDAPGLSKWIFRWVVDDLPSNCWQHFDICSKRNTKTNTLVLNLISACMIYGLNAPKHIKTHRKSDGYMMSPKQNDMENHLLILPGSQHQYLSELLTIYGRTIKILSTKKNRKV